MEFLASMLGSGQDLQIKAWSGHLVLCLQPFDARHELLLVADTDPRFYNATILHITYLGGRVKPVWLV